MLTTAILPPIDHGRHHATEPNGIRLVLRSRRSAARAVRPERPHQRPAAPGDGGHHAGQD